MGSPMFRVFLVLLMGCVLTLVGGEAVAQQPAVVPVARIEIRVGESIADAQRSLHDRDIPFARNSLELVNSDATDHLTFDLDKSHAFAVLFYSKAKQVITAIDFVSWPTGHQAKLTRSWIPATSISVESDGSYSVKFTPPTE
jgi:hypothetical protein